jgi:hypothetical protein
METATELEVALVVAEFKLPIPKRIVRRERVKYLKKITKEGAK